MSLTLRLLAGHGTSNSSKAPPAQNSTVDSDFIVILASLLCALICVLGLIAAARCAWIRWPWSRAKANKGVKKKVLRSLPKERMSREGGGECAICLTEFRAGEEIRVLPQCGHRFHVACIDRWLGTHSSCPWCREILLAGSGRCGECSSGGGAAATGTPVINDSEREERFLP